jgi:hypothetical protein
MQDVPAEAKNTYTFFCLQYMFVQAYYCYLNDSVVRGIYVMFIFRALDFAQPLLCLCLARID